ncbi:hypothetical protein EAE99_007758 [Botrytis elliptica]|nr:hypothetical protein EAE99_007758 [Botrytis elliptica]
MPITKITASPVVTSAFNKSLCTMPPEKQFPQRRWRMYPSLHNSVACLLRENDLNFTFHEVDDSHGCIKEYDTTIRGRFACYKRTCSSKGWGSNKIAITIRMYDGDRYNARVYAQRCNQCEILGRPKIDEKTYAERIAYRLKKWKGVPVEQPLYIEKETPPHNEDLCEGCKAGHCSNAR